MMGAINNLCENLERKFGKQIKVIPYNIFYDDASEIDSLIRRVIQESIALPAVFVEDDLEVEGYVDEFTVTQILKDRGLSSNGQPLATT